MLQYPSIDKIIRDADIYAFDKLDGSNIRVEWTRKNGFAKFGSRRTLIDENHTFLSDAIPLFMKKYADDLHEIFKKERYDKVTAFYEFHSPNSKFGRHVEERHEVTLFDVNVSRKGFILPKDFIKMFADIDTAPLLYRGKANSDFVESVKNRTLEGMTYEGVVCKGGYDKKNRLLSFKLKSDAWLQELREDCGDDDVLFEKLA